MQNAITLNPLDEALLSGIDAVLAHYERTVAIMARNKATQERATLNEHDLAQLARCTVLRCYASMRYDSNIRSFDGLVKDAIRKRLLTEHGKEFCKSRGRFLIEEFSEIVQEENNFGYTPRCAQTAYQQYNARMSADSEFELLVDELRALLPDSCLVVFQHLIDRETGVLDKSAKAALLKTKNLSLGEFKAKEDEIRMNLMGHLEDFDLHLKHA